MKDQFVNHTQALALKELGYSEYSIFGSECSLFKSDGSHTFYMNGVGDETYTSAPLKSQVIEWFRKEHNLIGQSIPLSSSLTEPVTTHGWSIKCWENDGAGFDIYEEAELACIDKLIKILEDDLERSN